MDKVTRLHKLSELLDKGDITRVEFDLLKDQLLRKKTYSSPNKITVGDSNIVTKPGLGKKSRKKGGMITSRTKGQARKRTEWYKKWLGEEDPNSSWKETYIVSSIVASLPILCDYWAFGGMLMPWSIIFSGWCFGVGVLTLKFPKGAKKLEDWLNILIGVLLFVFFFFMFIQVIAKIFSKNDD